ncbi:MAG: tetratricopeptide repeat protein [Pseudomonadota bacterium]
MERRLAAILAADVVGYTAMMGADESGTLRRLTALRRDLLEPLIDEHQGRIVKLMGDGLLVEFASVVHAVSCALAWQDGVGAIRAEDRAERLQFRIGINLGDVIVEGDDIFGDGVNLAARLEGLSEPGGICISEDAYRQAKGKTAALFEDMGEQTLKNVAEPVRTYRLATGESAEPGQRVGEALPLPEKPSIAVLPFNVPSGDEEQECFADGMTEDLITALSKIRWFFVIARNSTFAHKGRAVDMTKLGRELGVRYLLEGSLRQFQKRVRVSVQLIDASSGRHVWAERFDRELDDIFALQDEMTQTIVRAIEPELGSAERERAIRKPPGSRNAWDLFQRGLWHHYRFTREDIAKGREFFQQAIAADPNFAQPLAALAHVCYWQVLLGYVDDARATLAEGLGYARQAVSLDDKEPLAHFALGRVHTLRGDLDSAKAEFRQAVALNPNCAFTHYGFGLALILDGDLAAALDHIDRALRLNPHDPAIWAFLAGRALAHLVSEEFAEAATWARRSVQSATAGVWAYAVEAAALGHLGRTHEAASALAETYRLKPGFSTDFVREVFPFRDPGHLEPILDGLGKAGMKK